METIEILKVVNEEEYSRKKLLEEVKTFVLDNETIKNFVASEEDGFCYDVMVGHSKEHKALAFVVTLLGKDMEELSTEKLVVITDEALVLRENIEIDDIKDLEPIITTTYMVAK